MNREKLFKLYSKEVPTAEDFRDIIKCLVESVSTIQVSDVEIYLQEWETLVKSTNKNEIIKNSVTDASLISDYIFPLAIFRWMLDGAYGNSEIRKDISTDSFKKFYDFYYEFICKFGKFELD